MPRLLTPVVQEALAAFPVVVITGPRQTGKTTLARDMLGGETRNFRTLDDLRVLDLATRDPDLLVGEAPELTLDEVQRAPELLRAIKRAVDADRRAGRFLLTGSANLLLMATVSETLAGRAVYLALSPLTESEKAGRRELAGWTALLSAANPDIALGLLRSISPLATDWSAAACEGGFPPVLSLSLANRQRWHESYVATYLERDLQQLSSISALADFRRLLALAAQRTGALLNRAELGRDAGLSRPTTHRWLNLLEVSFHARLLQPYAVNRTKRLVKSPKLYFRDTGLAAHLAGIADAEQLASGAHGAWLENLILGHLDAWRETMTPRPEVYYWRTADGAEVDLVVEHRQRLLPIEVKASSRVSGQDVRHLDEFCREYGAPLGIIIYAGSELYQLSRHSLAVPLTFLI